MSVRKVGVVMTSSGGGALKTYVWKFISNAASDRIVADEGPNELFGNGGNDRLEGRGGNDELFGGAGNDSLYGGAGDDVLIGGKGKDVLIGGKGADYFVFDGQPSATNLDVIKDFSRTQRDKIALSLKIFSGLEDALVRDSFGMVKQKMDTKLDVWTMSFGSSALRLGTEALDADDRIVYDRGTGNLFYDADGNGAGVAVQIARLKAGTVLKASDFLLY